MGAMGAHGRPNARVSDPDPRDGRVAAPGDRSSRPLVPSRRLTRPSPPPSLKALLLALFYIVGWACASSGLIFLNSHLLNEDGFHYPMTLCSMGWVIPRGISRGFPPPRGVPFFARPSGSPLSPFLSRDSLAASWTISSVLVNLGVSKLDKSKDITLRWYVKHVLPIGAFAAVSLALGNYTYLYLSVSFIQMLKAAVPCVTMIVLVGTGLERPHRMTVLGVSILTFGTALAAYGEISFQWIGVFMMFSSEFSEAFRMAVLQYLLGNLRFELIDGLYIMAPASFGFLVLGIMAFEWEALRVEDGLGKIAENPHKYAAAAFLGFLVNLLTLGVIKSTSSLTFKVMGQVKNTVVIVMSVLIFGSAITGLQVFGYAVSMVGFAVYQRGKQVQARDAAPDGTAVGMKEMVGGKGNASA